MRRQNRAEENLRAWVSSAGGFVHPDACLCAEEHQKERKAIVVNTLKAGTVLLKIPVDLCFVGTPTVSAQSELAGEHLNRKKDCADAARLLLEEARLTPFLRLALRILYEFSKIDDSSAKPFLDSLPQAHNCLLGWTPAEKALLTGTTIQAEAGTDIINIFRTDVEPILNKHPAAWRGKWATFDAFKDICGIVQSRTFHLQANNWLTGISNAGSELYLIPGIDMVNHSTDPAFLNASLHRREEPQGPKNDLPSEPMQSFFTLETDVDVSAGTELMLSYGDLSDAELLTTFGFIDACELEGFKNPHNKVNFQTALLQGCFNEFSAGRQVAKNYKRRKGFLKEAGLLPEVISISSQNPIPDNLVTALQVLLLPNEKEYKSIRREISAAKDEGKDVALLGKGTLDGSKHCITACTILLRAADKHLKAYDALKGEEDEHVDPHRRALAAHVRRVEREIVEHQRRELLRLMMDLTMSEDESEDED